MASFDSAAVDYDVDFTQTLIGQKQRQLVWDYLERALPNTSISILELNAGTGEDAVFLAHKKHKVVCTDASESMLDVARQKAKEKQLQIEFHRWDLNQAPDFDATSSFDLVFSNFAGLNCISPETLKKLNKPLRKMLKPGGKFIGVFLGRFCWWESLYFLLKGNTKAAFRRQQKEAVTAQLGEHTVATWYYSPKEIHTHLGAHFTPVNTLPIGALIPPSYLQPFFKKRPFWVNFFFKTEQKIQFSTLAHIADHYLVEWKKLEIE